MYNYVYTCTPMWRGVACGREGYHPLYMVLPAAFFVEQTLYYMA